jgi:UDP-glucose 4-epimerase
VLAAAARHGRWLLFTSTSEVYGKNSTEALQEDSDRIVGSPFKARWGYAISKSLGEALAHAYYREQGSRIVVTRLFNTTGPRQTGAYGMVLPRFVRQALNGEDLTVFGDGTQSRCFVHVLDTVHALLQLAEAEAAIGNVYNIGSPVETAIIELAGRVLERTQSASKIRLVPYAEAYDEGFEELGRRKPDTSALAELVGWSPSRTLEETIDDLISYERGRETAGTGSLRLAG